MDAKVCGGDFGDNEGDVGRREGGDGVGGEEDEGERRRQARAIDARPNFTIDARPPRCYWSSPLSVQSPPRHSLSLTAPWARSRSTTVDTIRYVLLAVGPGSPLMLTSVSPFHSALGSRTSLHRWPGGAVAPGNLEVRQV